MAAQRKTAGGKGGVGAPKGQGSSDIRLPGEKAVRSTAKSVPVKPAARQGAPDHPTDPAAVDRRHQVVGTDEPRGRTDAKRGKGSK